MADEIDLRFLAEQSKRILAELAEARTERAEIRAELAEVREDVAGLRGDMQEVRAEQHALASLLGKVSDAVTAVARTQEHHSQVLARHSELFGQVIETQQSHGGRLNAIESRLAIIERHTGLVKA